MPRKYKYSHDHFILLLNISSIFFGILSIANVVIRLSSQSSTNYFIQYRPNLGLNAFQTGGQSNIVAFIIFTLVILIFNILLSYRVYYINRNFAITILSLGILLLVISFLISNALLGLH